MGLDMYLYAEKYISEVDYGITNGEFTKEYNPEYARAIRLFPEGATDLVENGGMKTSLQIGYWRKVNQIHGWFVKHCADNVDECDPTYVDAGQLRALRVICEFLLDNRNADNIEERINEELPLTDGFFFGSREIDEWYWVGLEQTIPILAKAIELAEEHECAIFYQASW
jgi:hypothetical protein